MIGFVRYWIPLLLWMWLIFTASADTQSTQRTSRILEPVLRWVWPDITPEAVDSVRWVVRKGAHMTEYALLAWLCWRALRRPVRRDARPWSWRTASWAMFASVVYAITDEYHQTHVANRSGTFMDVCIDALGAACGLLLVWWCWRRVNRSPSTLPQTVPPS